MERLMPMNKWVIAVLAAACVAGTGCGKKAAEKLAEKLMEKSAEKDGVKADVDISGGGITIESTDKAGKKIALNISEDQITIDSQDGLSSFASGSAAKVPDNFPEDVLVYAGSKVLSAMVVPKGFNLSLETGDGAEQVLGKYKSEMTSKGWEEKSSFNMERHSVIAYNKGPRTANVMVNAGEKRTQINLTVISKED